jgi:hypothetical protein
LLALHALAGVVQTPPLHTSPLGQVPDGSAVEQTEPVEVVPLPQENSHPDTTTMIKALVGTILLLAVSLQAARGSKTRCLALSAVP